MAQSSFPCSLHSPQQPMHPDFTRRMIAFLPTCTTQYGVNSLCHLNIAHVAALANAPHFTPPNAQRIPQVHASRSAPRRAQVDPPWSCELSTSVHTSQNTIDSELLFCPSTSKDWAGGVRRLLEIPHTAVPRLPIHAVILIGPLPTEPINVTRLHTQLRQNRHDA